MILIPEARIQAMKARGWWGEATFDDLFTAQVTRRSDTLALVDPVNAMGVVGRAPRRLTWGQIADEVDRMTAVLHAAGVRRDDVVVVQLPNIGELTSVYLACARLGVIVTPAPAQYRESELAHIVARTDAVAAITAAYGLTGAAAEDAKSLFPALYKAFVEKDMDMLEVNPLIVMKDGHLRVLDAKVSFDGNALFRHDDIKALRDETEEDAKEIEASKWDLAYVSLDGNIGCMVNGAGLAMATMDIIKLYGKEPANFCDVGGGAGKEKVAAAFKIITADPNVQGILVNIFGGIMKCDVIAEGVVAAVKEVGLKVPLVVRLEGTNAELGKKILNESGLTIQAADDLDDAAQKIVAAVG
ncbi:MAG TPA: hypothetical protein DDY79_16670 [Brevundimonas sp.]|nr:hypothetical protein [Brevundimonas sp.]